MKMQIGFYNEENTYQCSDRYQSTENVNTFIAGLSIFYIDKKQGIIRENFQVKWASMSDYKKDLKLN